MYRGTPNEWGYNENLKYTKRTKDDNHLVIISPNLYNNEDKNDKVMLYGFMKHLKNHQQKNGSIDTKVDLIKNLNM